MLKMRQYFNYSGRSAKRNLPKMPIVKSDLPQMRQKTLCSAGKTSGYVFKLPKEMIYFYNDVSIRKGVSEFIMLFRQWEDKIAWFRGEATKILSDP